MGALIRLQDELSSLRRYILAKREKPHKLILLLAVLDLYEAGTITCNEIHFGTELTDAFNKRFVLHANQEDWAQVSLPFFHLRTAYFWKHEVLPGRQKEYDVLTTSGGGSKRIRENIAFAFFEEEVWELIQNDHDRREIFSSIMEIINTNNEQKSEINPQKLKTSFTESFRLSRSGLSQILGAFVSAEENHAPKPTDLVLQNVTTLGTNQVTSNVNFARGGNLLKRNGEVTDFGRIVYDCDPNLSRIETQWLFHYFLCVSHGLGAIFWNKTVTQFFLLGNALTKKDTAEFIQTASLEANEKQVVFSTYESAATAILSSYSAEDGLNKLGLLEGPDKNQYLVRTPQPIPTAAFACILADYWQAKFPNTASIDEELLTQSELPRLLLLGIDGFNAKLAELADPQLGHLQRQRRFTPPQVLRRWTDTAPLWAALYA